ncbi:MAG: hypothetical protein IPI20_10605 [Rhodoferax sp.]|jgi:hypothetical protein|nr:hypothetical protein [Rhodoferax sp.]
MNQNRLFRVLVTCNWFLQLLLYLLPLSSWYADPMIEKLMALDGYGAIANWTNPIIAHVPIVGFLVASIGLLFFSNWARYLYLALWLCGWFATLLFGFRVSAPTQGFIGMAIGTIDGMVLYLSFLSALRASFKSNADS